MNAPAKTSAAEALWSWLGPLSAVVSLALLAIGAYLMDQAQPQVANLLDKRWDSAIRPDWDLPLARRAFTLLLGSAAVSALGLAVNLVARRGKGDAASRFLIVFLALALLGVAFYAIKGPGL